MKKALITQHFIDCYNQLDDHMRKLLNAEAYIDHGTLLKRLCEQNRVFSAHYKDLKMYSELRNLLVHNPYGKNADPLLIPHEYVLNRYKEIINYVLHPKKALEIAVKREFIYTTTMEGNLIEVMEIMNKNTFTHIPVMEKDRMVGVFSENTLLSYLAHNKDSLILKDCKISEFKNFIPIDKHPSEYFEFVSREALIVDVEELFKTGLRERKRIAVVYITQTGKQTEKLLGMITAWDIAGNH